MASREKATVCNRRHSVRFELDNNGVEDEAAVVRQTAKQSVKVKSTNKQCRPRQQLSPKTPPSVGQTLQTAALCLGRVQAESAIVRKQLLYLRSLFRADAVQRCSMVWGRKSREILQRGYIRLVKKIVNDMDAFPDDVEVQACALKAMVILLKNEVNADRAAMLKIVMVNTGFEAVTTALTKHARYSSILLGGLWLFSLFKMEASSDKNRLPVASPMKWNRCLVDRLFAKAAVMDIVSQSLLSSRLIIALASLHVVKLFLEHHEVYARMRETISVHQFFNAFVARLKNAINRGERKLQHRDVAFLQPVRNHFQFRRFAIEGHDSLRFLD